MGAMSSSKRIGLWRKLRKMTLRELGEASGLGYTTIHRLEHGYTPTHEHLVAIAKGLNIPFLRLTEKGATPPCYACGR